ncbi:hypothetical protein [Thermotoga profunda]|uniref:hypothetical protein n=1 Tax=Thermotoga profunda TaxID=1508420 RepID=UPI000597C206|nr:hypothetical protein [Thermotoga profunda]
MISIGSISIQILIYLIVSLIFVSIAAVILNTVITHFRKTIGRVDREIDFFMAVDFLRMDFWFHSISVGNVSKDGNAFIFREKIDQDEKLVSYFVEKVDGVYQLKRIANDGINIIYKSTSPMFFCEPTKDIWAIQIEGFWFEMINATPTELRDKLYKGKVKTPDFLLPKLIEVRNK